MRIAMNSLMINKWNILGNYQSRYVPGMIGPFLKVSLIPHTGMLTYMCIIGLPHNMYVYTSATLYQLCLTAQLSGVPPFQYSMT